MRKDPWEEGLFGPGTYASEKTIPFLLAREARFGIDSESASLMSLEEADNESIIIQITSICLYNRRLKRVYPSCADIHYQFGFIGVIASLYSLFDLSEAKHIPCFSAQPNI